MRGVLKTCGDGKMTKSITNKLLRAGASWGGFTTAQYLSQGGDFFGKIVVQYLAYFLGLYFAIGVFLDLFLLGATAFAGINYSTNAEAFLKAVKQARPLSSHPRLANFIVK